MVSGLMDDFPCFEFGLYILEELKLVLGKTGKQMERIFQRAKGVTETLTKMVPARQIVRKVNLYTSKMHGVVYCFSVVY